MKLSKWAIQQAIHYQTAWQWYKDGRIANAYQTSTGLIFVADPRPSKDERVVSELNQKQKN